MGILEKIEEIEKEMSRTQKNKATEYHLGLLKAKLARYRAELLEPDRKSAKGEGFDVMKSGGGFSQVSVESRCTSLSDWIPVSRQIDAIE
jgi:ribosome-interacting GTPase 1